MCLERIRFANLKKEGESYTHHRSKNGNKSSLDFKLCHLFPAASAAVHATFPSSSSLGFLSFHPLGLLLPPFLLWGRQEGGLAASAPQRAGVAIVLEISSLGIWATFWALRLHTELTHMQIYILSSVWLQMPNRLVRSPTGKRLQKLYFRMISKSLFPPLSENHGRVERLFTCNRIMVESCLLQRLSHQAFKESN